MSPITNKEKAGNGGVIPPPKSRFSKDNQPSREAQAKGAKKRWERAKLKDRLSEIFAAEISLKSGEKIVGYEALGKRILKYFLGDGNDKKALTNNQVKNAIKFIEMMAPSELKLSGDKKSPVAIKLFFDKEDKDA